ncbi:histidine kinase [Blastococcus sp. CT_GayMR16]|uniref:GAF domain-containing sensor histidine kinase n=1 Tax=Blastococcus sp. CT_GayMR16 TaxID=2559607 RepID=UPI00107332CA|nr:histidine kinase [Blastococcus sp. CT_GayMR16]TFV90033.1 histidine kinase [Blastococcus sp. CT_GayMR16]
MSGNQQVAGSPPVAGRHRGRTARRLAWAVAGLSGGLGVASLILIARHAGDPRVEIDEYWPAAAIMAIAFPVVGVLIVSRHPRHAIGWLLSGIGLSIAVESATGWYATVALLPGSDLPAGEFAAWLSAWTGDGAFASLSFLALLFPDGRLPSPRWRPLAWLIAGLALALTLDLLLRPGPLDDHPAVPNPTGIEGFERFVLPVAVGATLYLGSIVAAVASLVVRFRRAQGAERQQVKWFGYAFALIPPALIGNVLFPDWAWLIGGLAVAALPAAIGVAVLRYRLFDIDVIINRTLVYGTLTVGLVAGYVGVVGYLGTLLRSGTDLAVSLVATAVVAILFAPARDRLQRAVDRLLYGERRDPYAAVAALDRRLAVALAPDEVLPAIVDTIRVALRLPYAAIELLRGDTVEIVASAGDPTPGGPLVLPLSYGGEEVGRLVLAPRGPGEGFSPADRRLIDVLAGHAGVAVHGVRTMADLQRSRERLVLAREEERRRLRRDLHDELAPTLAALGLRAATVGELIAADPEQAAKVNDALRANIRAAVRDVRLLVHDLRPPALDELGLIEAIRDRADRTGGPPTTVEAPAPLPPLPAAVEVAAYRITAEALTNAAKHAAAHECRVRLCCADGRVLEVEVTDDGVGLPERPRSGVGLISMRERAAELGGTCEIHRLPPPAGGTSVRAHLPLLAPAGGPR